MTCRKAHNKIDLVGENFGRLTVLVEAQPSRTGKARWRCRCVCGEYCVAVGVNLRNGHTQSCGCLQLERTSEARTTHGKTETRLYTIWTNMRQRCTNPNSTYFENYGGRGITICEEWDSFERFHAWALRAGYRDDLTIDRIDNDKCYSPDNCRWADWFVQASNRRPAKLKAFAEDFCDD